MYLTNASISALFRRIELFAALSGLFFAHNSLKINCFHHWDGLQILFRLAAAKGAGATVFPFIDYRYLRPAWLSAVIQKYADVPEPTTIESNVLFVIFVPKLESDPCEMSSPVCVPIPYSVFPTVL